MSHQLEGAIHQFALGTQVEQVFAEIVGAVEVGLYVYQVADRQDPGSLRLVYANPASVAATGVEFGQIIGRPLRDAFPNLMQTSLPGLYLAIALGGEAREIGDVEYEDARVTQQVFSVRAFPLPHETVGVSFTNLTAQRLAEQRAIQTLESMSDAFLTLDDQWRFTYLNPQSEPILERRREELVGKNIWEEFPDAVGSTFYDEYHRAAQEQVPVQFVEAYEPLDKILDVRAYPIVSGLAVYYRDVTKASLVEAQLRQAQRLEAVGRVTASVAHDFNNLLTAIRGFAQLGEAAAHDPVRAAKYFGEIDAAGKKAAELTRQLLAFGKQQHLSPTTNDLNETVSGLTTLLRHLLPIDIRLEIETDPAPVPVHVDRAQLEQVILNLVVNSRDAIDRTGTITIRTSRTAPKDLNLNEPAEQHGWVQVIDDGSGIPPELLPRIFEPFFTTKPPDTGTGLGLATIYGIVTQSHGDVYVNSTPGEGTTITVTLPSTDPAAS